MLFHPTAIPGAYLIEPERISDQRGFFARTWCRNELAEHGLVTELAQCSISFNTASGTLRGMHYQAAPHGEAKLVRCTSGAIYDVIIDLRPESPAYLQYVAAELSAANRMLFYIPEGCAHGFLTLADNSEVFYQISAMYTPSAARGVRYNDPVFAIPWPSEARVISDRDRDYPDFIPDQSARTSG
jgi:dTDP-4-dehydrorhamnose 3,5-epimerase